MVKNIFSKRSSRILRVLLSKPSQTWRTRRLASEANVSLGSVSAVTNRLIDMGFLVRDRSMSLKLRKEEELLRRWASSYDLTKWTHKTYYARGTLYDIGTGLAAAAERNSLKYAFSGPFAADLLTRYIRSAEIHVYVRSEDTVKKIVDCMNLEIAEIGGNIIFLIADDDSVFYGLNRITDNRVSDVLIVSNVQLVLDLYNYTDRAREAAERLLTKEFIRRSEQINLVKLAREYFEQEGLIPAEHQAKTLDPRPDAILFDPETQTYLIVECKNAHVKLDSVDRLKRFVSSFGQRAKGVLVAPSITNAAMEELRKTGLEFKSVERIEYGLHKRRS